MREGLCYILSRICQKQIKEREKDMDKKAKILVADDEKEIRGILGMLLAEEGYEGIGFAIPVNDAKPIIESLIQSGYVTGRVYIGITYRAISETIAELNSIPRGLRVIAIDENADVAKQGLQVGDIITKLDDTEVYDSETVDAVLTGKKPGDSIKITVYRVNTDTGVASTLEITATLAEKTS